jgi:hypothetical protein
VCPDGRPPLSREVHHARFPTRDHATLMPLVLVRLDILEEAMQYDEAFR